MRVVVLGGSPKGEVSVTMQYVEFLRLRFPEHEFRVHQVAHRIGRLVRDADAFEEVIDDVAAAELVLWAFPLYILLVCSQYKRFIELVTERGRQVAFGGRYAASISTSINFYDTTAHNYIQAVSEDLGMQFAGFYSANMNDLRSPTEQERLTGYFMDLEATVAGRLAIPRRYAPLPPESGLSLAGVAGSAELEPRGRNPAATAPIGKRLLILTDEAHAAGPQPLQRVANLRAMTSRLARAWAGQPRVVDLAEVGMRGGCLGCLECGQEFRCRYEGKDGFTEFFRNEVMAADIIVFAGAIVDRQLSWRWRQFFDRSFFNTHTPVLTGRQVAFLVAGPLSHLPDFRMVYEAWMEIQEANLVGFVSDEDVAGDAAKVLESVDALAERMVRLAEAGYVRPQTFLGIAGRRIFRDDIFGHLRIVFPADHRAYRERGYYDFPTRKPIRRLAIAALSAVLKLPFVRKEFVKGIKGSMAGRFRSVLARVKPARR